MTAEKCAAVVLRAARRRKREVLMRPGPLAQWLKLLAPGLVEKVTVDRFLKPAIKRAAGKVCD
jgi:hypothetical protein